MSYLKDKGKIDNNCLFFNVEIMIIHQIMLLDSRYYLYSIKFIRQISADNTNTYSLSMLLQLKKLKSK